MDKMVVVFINNKVYPINVNNLSEDDKRYRLNINEKNYFTKKEWDRLNYLRHIPNLNKSKEEFKEYCFFADRIGMPKPNRESKIRPLHEKYDKHGNLLNLDFIIK